MSQRRHWCSHCCALCPACCCTRRSNFPCCDTVISLYSHGILGVVFTLPVGYSRPPSAVNDPTVMKQVNSENHTSNKWPTLFYQVSLINRCWVRLRGDAHKKNATMILASSTKTKNSFATIFDCVELHLLCLLLSQGRQCLFEVRYVPDWHCIGTNVVQTNPPINSVIINSS